MKRVFCAALLIAACAAAPGADPWPSSAPPVPETVGWLDERPVTYGEVARYLRTRDPEAFFRNLEGLVLERVTRAEAGPLGVRVPAALLARETQLRMAEWESRVRAVSRGQGGEEIDPALWLQRVSGMSLAQFRGHVRRHTEVELLQDRLLRFEQLSSRRIEVSVLVVEEEEQARDLLERLRGGGEFAALAREHSRHSSASAGGRIPFPLLEPDINDPVVRAALFGAASGALLGPFPTGGGYRQLYRVEAVHAARSGRYADLEEEVVRDLEARPVPVGEYERWRRRILLRHGFHAAPPPGEVR